MYGGIPKIGAPFFGVPFKGILFYLRYQKGTPSPSLGNPDVGTIKKESAVLSSTPRVNPRDHHTTPLLLSSQQGYLGSGFHKTGGGGGGGGCGIRLGLGFRV